MGERESEIVGTMLLGSALGIILALMVGQVTAIIAAIATVSGAWLLGRALRLRGDRLAAASPKEGDQ